MVAEQEFLAFAEGELGVPGLSLEATCGSLAQWDSMAQLRLVMALEKRFGLSVPFAEVPIVTSLWEFYRRLNRLSPKKAVAVDFDGVLWSGVVGEDGSFALRPRLDFQRQLKALKQRGVLLVGLTKNSEEDALAGLSRTRGELAAEDFVAIAANWQPKADNLLRIARELNLAPEAFVFVDDNPVERAQMRVMAPEVTVAAFPPRLEAYFPAGATTAEDVRRTELYREEAERRRFAEKVSPSDYLAGLEQHVDVHPIRPDECDRVAQLSQKANQYVAAVRRYSADEVRTMAADPTRTFLTAHCRDRFGDLGLVGFASAKDGVVDAFTLSCRAAGREVERVLAAELRRLAAGQGTLVLDYRPSARNAPAAAFANLFV